MDNRKKILVVDDNPRVRNSFSASFSRSGFEVVTAVDREQGLERLQHSDPDLLILDALMPRLDGRETLRKIRRADNWIRVILPTQVGEASERAMALEEGADDYINRPFEAQELVARTRAVLRRANPETLHPLPLGF